jgi:hypothetical protein
VIDLAAMGVSAAGLVDDAHPKDAAFAVALRADDNLRFGTVGLICRALRRAASINVKPATAKPKVERSHAAPPLRARADAMRLMSLRVMPAA